MRKIRTAGYAVGIILSLALALYVFGKPLVFHAAQYGLRKSLPQYETSLGSARITYDSLSLYDIHAKNKNISFDAGETQISFKPVDLIQGKISKIAVKNSTVRARGPADKILAAIPSFASSAKLSGYSLHPSQLEIAALTLDIRSDALALNGSLSLRIDLSANKIVMMETRISSAESHGFSVKNMSMSFDKKNGGRLSAESIGYQKLAASALQSPFHLDGKLLKIEPIHGVILDGNLEGRFQMQLDGGNAYELNLTLQQLSLPALISDLKFEDKMSMTGRFLGNIVIHGNSSGMDSVDGTLSGSNQGGDLVILDEVFLGNIASRMNQPLELVKAGLKEYHYDTGEARLLKNGRDLGLDLSLDGPKGKRQLSTVFHDTV